MNLSNIEPKDGVYTQIQPQVQYQSQSQSQPQSHSQDQIGQVGLHSLASQQVNYLPPHINLGLNLNHEFSNRNIYDPIHHHANNNFPPVPVHSLNTLNSINTHTHNNSLSHSHPLFMDPSYPHNPLLPHNPLNHNLPPHISRSNLLPNHSHPHAHANEHFNDLNNNIHNPNFNIEAQAHQAQQVQAQAQTQANQAQAQAQAQGQKERKKREKKEKSGEDKNDNSPPYFNELFTLTADQVEAKYSFPSAPGKDYNARGLFHGKPISAYLEFCQDRRPILSNHPLWPIHDSSKQTKLLSHLWKNTSHELKQKYKNSHAKALAAYELDITRKSNNHNSHSSINNNNDYNIPLPLPHNNNQTNHNISNPNTSNNNVHNNNNRLNSMYEVNSVDDLEFATLVAARQRQSERANSLSSANNNINNGYANKSNKYHNLDDNNYNGAGASPSKELYRPEEGRINNNNNNSNNSPDKGSIMIPSPASSPSLVCRLPLARVRRLLDSNGNVSVTGKEPLLLIQKATEEFLSWLTLKCASVTDNNRIKEKDFDYVSMNFSCLSFIRASLKADPKANTYTIPQIPLASAPSHSPVASRKRLNEHNNSTSSSHNNDGNVNSVKKMKSNSISSITLGVNNNITPTPLSSNLENGESHPEELEDFNENNNNNDNNDDEDNNNNNRKQSITAPSPSPGPSPNPGPGSVDSSGPGVNINGSAAAAGSVNGNLTMSHSYSYESMGGDVNGYQVSNQKFVQSQLNQPSQFDSSDDDADA